MHLRNWKTDRKDLKCDVQVECANWRGYGHVIVLKFCRSSWCSASRGFVSDSWATCI